MAASTARRDPAIVGALVLVLAVVLCTNAWVVDDAYITFRTVENFVGGDGLTWNPAERVQAYTHPLWMFVVSLAYLVTREFFWTVTVLSLALTLGATLIAIATVTDRLRGEVWRGWALVLSLLASKAALDYASSGLENCLSYVIAAAFVSQYLVTTGPARPDEKRLRNLVLLASLGFLNRADTILLFLPALLHASIASRPIPRARRVATLVIATLPATGWLLFSLVYYGYPSPNTAYAKVIRPGFPFAWTLLRGVEYWANSVAWDGASWAALAGATFFAVRQRCRTAAALLAGIALSIGFVVTTAAAATHMAGRFFAVPLFVAAILFARLIPGRGFAVAAGGGLAAFMALSPVSAVKFGTPLYRPPEQKASRIDTKWFVANEGAALLSWRPGKRMPDHAWFREGEALKTRPERVFVGGAFGGAAIGYVAFAAGPGKHFIDRVALGDPLLSRLPAARPARSGDWKSGHFERPLPAGYVESIVSGTNRLVDPGLREYYERVRTLTRGPVWDPQRFVVIAKMNLGLYEPLLVAAKREIQEGPEARRQGSGER